jgi:penicillin-binding protein 1A
MKGKSLSWIFKTLFILALASTVIGSAVGGAVFWYFSRQLPNIITVGDYRPLVVTRVLGKGANGEDVEIGEFFKERRYLAAYETMPDLLIKAFISAEDDQFFSHQGINLASILRASIANFRAGHVVQGGSTITQQVAKSLLLTPERSFSRKIKEVILASRIEKNLDKKQILYLYLNQIYLGHGAYGVESAARTFFRKNVGALTLAEAALLAGMPQAPGKYSPHLNPKRAKERQLYVLRRMYENGFITQAQMSESAAEALKIYHDEDLNTKYAGHYVEYIRRQLVEKYGEKAVYEDGLTVKVPLRVDLALAAKKSLEEGLRAVDKRVGFRGPIKTLPDSAAIEEYLKDQRARIIERKLGYQLMLPDGRLGTIEAMKAAGFSDDQQLLAAGEVCEGVVTSVDDKKKSAGVLIGAVRAEIPFEKGMKWAHQARDEKNPTAFKPDPTAPSRVVKKGDVVQVRVLKADGPEVIAALEQEPQVQGALFSLDVETGNVLAMEGGYRFQDSEFNRAMQAQRQPGSAFKPIIYAAGLEKGYTPASVIVDSPMVYNDEESGKWKPSNFEEKFYGDTTFRQALIKSRNIPTIKIVQSIRVPYLIDYARRLGLNAAQFNADFSISLGSAAVSLFDLTRVYALFPRLGKRIDATFLDSITDRDGKPLDLPSAAAAPVAAATPRETSSVKQPSPSPSPGASGRPVVVIPQYPTPEEPDRLMDPRVAYVMTHLMKEVVSFGTGYEAKSLGRPAAGKTGTTNEYIDAWFMGFTPHVVTGVWVGFDNHRAIGPGETGARAALPIWLGFMREAVKNYPDNDFSIPPGVVFASINPVTGKLAASSSSNSIKEAFIAGTEPTEVQSGTGAATESQSEFLKEDIE